MPITKAPKSAWIPIASVRKLAASTAVSMAQMYSSFTGSPCGERVAIHAMQGRTAKAAKTTKATPESSTQRDTSGEPEPDRAMAKARRIQAATSLTAAADMAMRPMSVVNSFSSARMRASTGKAVIESATPMKTRNGAAGTPLLTVDRSTTETPMPRMNGSDIPASAMAKAFFPVRRMARMSSSRPTRKRKKRSPMLATVSSTVRLLFGKTRFKNAPHRPIADGPRRIPPFCVENKKKDGLRK